MSGLKPIYFFLTSPEDPVDSSLTGFPVNESTDTLPKIEANFPPNKVPCQISLENKKARNAMYTS